MTREELCSIFHAAAAGPRAQMDKYLAQGKKVVLTAPVYTPEELVHSMGLIPMGAWGADLELQQAKKYFPAFICSIVQSMVELGMRGSYAGASAILIPSLCDSLKVVGENWKYAVPSIPFIPMSYPQNRRPAFGIRYTRAGYERVIRDLERVSGATFSSEALRESIRVYNEHNAAMRRLDRTLARHPDVSAAQRSDIFKSAFFMEKSEHTALVNAFCGCLGSDMSLCEKTPIVLSGILADSPALNGILDELSFHIAADDVAAQSRQYRTDAPDAPDPLDSLALKFSAMGDCSVLYDREKHRCQMIPALAAARGARGVVVLLTKFCDPEEFDYPLLKKACDEACLPCVLLEIDRQMTGFEQARTLLETLRDTIGPCGVQDAADAVQA